MAINLEDSIVTLSNVRWEIENCMLDINRILPEIEMDWEPIHYGIEVIRTKLSTIVDELHNMRQELTDLDENDYSG